MVAAQDANLESATRCARTTRWDQGLPRITSHTKPKEEDVCNNSRITRRREVGNATNTDSRKNKQNGSALSRVLVHW